MSNRVSRPSTLFVRGYLLLTTYAFSQAPFVTGVVTDPSGGAIPNATIRCAPRSQPIATAAADGSFGFDPAKCAAREITVEAPGFASGRFPATASVVNVTLEPGGVDALVTVTGIEALVSESSASVAVVDRAGLTATPGSQLDDRLRQIPGFTLFRRTGSRTANPTSQGVSLRGVGASGASRALVLKDGVPLNDPFGAWVHWGRAVSESISEVEVLRGAGGDLYGTAAVGGVIAIGTIRPAAREFGAFDGSLGGQASAFSSVYTSVSRRLFRGSMTAEGFRTQGYIPVDGADRGSVDTPTNVRRSTLEPRIEVGKTHFRFFTNGEFYREVRENGTPLQNNDTRSNTYSSGFDGNHLKFGSIAGRVFGSRAVYHQSFSAIAENRDSETLSRLQTVPSKMLGGRFQWTLTRGTNTFLAGADVRRIVGRSDELAFNNSRPASVSNTGGRENTTGIFAGTKLRPIDPLIVDLGIRYDRWSEIDGRTVTRSLTNGAMTIVEYPDRTASALSPRAGIVLRLTGPVSLTAGFSRSFRQATLNELYRSFRLGNILTLAKADLGAERGTTGEAGLRFHGLDDRLYLRGNAYCTKVEGPVSNVTLAVTQALITRQRQNLGATRSCGLEADLELRVGEDLRLSAGYLHVVSKVTDAPGTSLKGTQLPQIPRDQFSLQAVYSGGRWGTATAHIRGSGSQFEDDLNTLSLRGFAVIDVLYSYPLFRRFTVYGAIENLTNSRIEAGRNPVTTLGQPFTARIGVRLRSTP